MIYVTMVLFPIPTIYGSISEFKNLDQWFEVILNVRILEKGPQCHNIIAIKTGYQKVRVLQKK